MYALHYREELAPAVVKELDDFIAWLHGYLSTSLNEDGTLKLSDPTSGDTSTTIIDQIEEEEGHWWKKGPWIFDRENEHVAVIYTASLPAGTINNFAPQGVDTCVGIEINTAGSISITGLKAPARNFRRLVFIRNQSATNTVTLKHQSTSSDALNRFALPGNVDIVMGAQQTTWLYYDADSRRWASFITGNTSGGLVGASTTTLPSGISVTQDAFTAVLDISTAQLDALNGTPLTVVPAAGANKIIVPVDWSVTAVKSGAAWTANPALSLVYSGNTSAIVTAINLTLTNANTETRFYHPGQAAFNFLTSTFDPRNVAVVTRLASDTSPGVGSTCTLRIMLTYYIHTCQ